MNHGKDGRLLSEYQSKRWMAKIAKLKRKFPERSGEANPHHILTWSQVNSIRRSQAADISLAREFNVSASWISRIRRYKVWVEKNGK
jgi:hypothetical protein